MASILHGVRNSLPVTRDVDEATFVTEGAPGQWHNRYIDSITATWPGDDTFAVTWTQAEDVRRFRILVTGGADGDYVKFVMDAANEAQAEAWLAGPTADADADVEWRHVYTSTPDANGTFIPLWSEWIELSRNPDDNSLSRLDFLGSAAAAKAIFIQAES